MNGWHPALGPAAQRWAIFLDKVRTRVGEIDHEARGAYTEVVSIDAVDGTALSGISSALHARLIALRKKVDDSWDTIDQMVDSANVDDHRHVSAFRGSQRALGTALSTEIERRSEAMIVHGEAHWARTLQQVAANEAHAPLACTQCGAPMQRPTSGPGVYSSVNLPCPACHAVVTCVPGTATSMFFGSGAHHLAKEVALPQWNAMEDAEDAYHRMRHPTHNDATKWEAAQVDYWRTYGTAVMQWNPAWTPQTVEDEIRGKLSMWRQTTGTESQDDRSRIGSGLAAVATNEPPLVVAWLQRQDDTETAVEDLMWAAFERGWRDHVPWIAQIAEPLGSEPGWAVEKMAEVAERYASTGNA